MSKMLLLSNSANEGQERLAHAKGWIKPFLGDEIKTLLLIPYAGIPRFGDKANEEYQNMLYPIFKQMGYNLVVLNKDHTHDKIRLQIKEAEGLVVAGGNTFALLDKLLKYNLMSVIRESVKNGVPYIGWSAGSNIACPTIQTTNDMPAVAPSSMYALSLVPFQINAHFPDKGKDVNPGAETREDRLTEVLNMNPNSTIIGLRNGSAIQIVGNNISLLGDKSVRVFKGGYVEEMTELTPLYSK